MRPLGPFNPFGLLCSCDFLHPFDEHDDTPAPITFVSRGTQRTLCPSRWRPVSPTARVPRETRHVPIRNDMRQSHRDRRHPCGSRGEAPDQRGPTTPGVVGPYCDLAYGQAHRDREKTKELVRGRATEQHTRRASKGSTGVRHTPVRPNHIKQRRCDISDILRPIPSVKHPVHTESHTGSEVPWASRSHSGRTTPRTP